MMLQQLTSRLLEPDELLPAELLSGFIFASAFDPDWVWVIEVEGEGIVACCIASPLHGAVALWRVASLPTAPTMWFRTLLRTLFEDCRARGFTKYFTMLEADHDNEVKLARIAERQGATVRGWTGYMVSGELEG